MNLGISRGHRSRELLPRTAVLTKTPVVHLGGPGGVYRRLSSRPASSRGTWTGPGAKGRKTRQEQGNKKTTHRQKNHKGKTPERQKAPERGRPLRARFLEPTVEVPTWRGRGDTFLALLNAWLKTAATREGAWDDKQRGTFLTKGLITHKTGEPATEQRSFPKGATPRLARDNRSGLRNHSLIWNRRGALRYPTSGNVSIRPRNVLDRRTATVTTYRRLFYERGAYFTSAVNAPAP